MRLRWFGQSAFLLTAREGTVMIDPAARPERPQVLVPSPPGAR